MLVSRCLPAVAHLQDSIESDDNPSTIPECKFTGTEVLAFCNTVKEAQDFAELLSKMGVPADHYNGTTRQLNPWSLSEGATIGGLKHVRETSTGHRF